MSILHNGPSWSDKSDAAFAKPLGEWKAGALSFEDFEAYQKILEKYPEAKDMDSAGRRKFFIEHKTRLLKEINEYHAQTREKRADLDAVSKKHDIIERLLEWSKDLKMEKPDGIMFRKMRKDFAADRTIYLDKTLYAETPKVDFEKEIFRFAEILLIEHDWAAAFDGADIPDAAVKLPYDTCAFEFRFSGRPVIVLATQFGTGIAFTPVILIDDIWVASDLTCEISTSAEWDDEPETLVMLFREVGRQIRAACISLDAEVAKAEVVREPHSGVHGRNAHQSLKPYHVVSLARRGPRPLAAPGVETGRRVRLHFRRGHWRHFETHKTWIRWMLVGDSDLGFIDKHYKL